MARFGENVLRLRRERGWTRRELARRSDLHEQHLLKIEKGLRKSVELHTIERLAKTFGVTPNDLLGWEEEKSSEIDPTTKVA